MLPKNVLGREMLTKLKVYATPDHPHAAQKPQPLLDRSKTLRQVERSSNMATADTRTYATGKRKTAIARVWLKPAPAPSPSTARPCDEYFERETSRMVMRQSLELIEAHRPVRRVRRPSPAAARAPRPRRCATASRARSSRSTRRSAASLKRAGFLTRDARKKERKKYGQPGARKRFQYSKR